MYCAGPLPSPKNLAQLVNASAVLELIDDSITVDQREKILANIQRDVKAFVKKEDQVSDLQGKSPRIAVSFQKSPRSLKNL